MSDDAMVEEFDTYASWTADAVRELGRSYALPAACRGSGSPAALDWLVDRLGLSEGTRLLDSGAGVGGPAEYAATTSGAVPVLVDPMGGACRAAARLFGRMVVVGEGSVLPFADRAFDAAWSLGVLCTVEDKAAHLRELARVVRAEGPLGLLVFVRTVDVLDDQPEGNSFPSRTELASAMQQAGLEAFDEVAVDDLPASPTEWNRAVTAVEAVIERDHRDQEAFSVAQQQSDHVGRLISQGLVAGHLVVCRAARTSGSGTTATAGRPD